MNWKALLFIPLITLFACGEDESCGEIGVANGECLDVAAVFDVLNITAGRNTTTTTEYLQITYQYGQGSPRFSYTLRANTYDGQTLDTEGEAFTFVTGREYTSPTMTFNGDFNTTGTVTTTFSSIDRTNGLVSGSFVWVQDENDFVDADTFTGTFSNVEVDFE